MDVDDEEDEAGEDDAEDGAVGAEVVVLAGEADSQQERQGLTELNIAPRPPEIPEISRPNIST